VASCLFFDYLYGTMYIKTGDMINQPTSTQCSLKFKTSVESWTSNGWKEEYVSYTHSCFEIDPMFAYFTLAFILYPGVMMFYKIFQMLESRQLKILAICCSPIIIASYPVVLILCKITSFFSYTLDRTYHFLHFFQFPSD
jgi:hypothetical protein